MNNAYVTTGVRRSLGGVYKAAVGTTIPTDADTALANDFKELGYVSEDGVTKSYSYDTTEVKEWGGRVVRVLQTEKTVTVQIAAIETENIETIKAVYGADNVSGTLTNGITVIEKDDELVDGCWVIDMVDLEGGNERIVIPNGVITDRGDEVYKRDEVVAYDFTITALPDASGNKVYTYMKSA